MFSLPVDLGVKSCSPCGLEERQITVVSTNTSVCKECAMMCAELQYEDADEDIVVYGTKGFTQKSTKKLHMLILQKPKVKKRKKLSIMWPKVKMTVCYWKEKGDNLMKLLPLKMHTMLVRVRLH